MTLILMFVLYCVFTPEAALGTINVGISGSNSSSSFFLESHKSTTISANVAIEVASFMHLGLTHRRSFIRKDGLKKEEISAGEYSYFSFTDNTDIVTNSIDVSIYPYRGLVSPFIFGGVARRDYYTKVSYRGYTGKKRETLPAVPNYGFGLAVMLSRSFNLKITQTYTIGRGTVLEEGQEVEQQVRDAYTQLGIGYKL